MQVVSYPHPALRWKSKPITRIDADLKQMVRTSIEHSFLPGDSIWAQPDDFTRTKPVCSAQKPGADMPSADCLDLLKHSEKAAQQWELEHRFTAFEASLP